MPRQTGRGVDNQVKFARRPLVWLVACIAIFTPSLPCEPFTPTTLLQSFTQACLAILSGGNPQRHPIGHVSLLPLRCARSRLERTCDSASCSRQISVVSLKVPGMHSQFSTTHARLATCSKVMSCVSSTETLYAFILEASTWYRDQQQIMLQIVNSFCVYCFWVSYIAF